MFLYHFNIIMSKIILKNIILIHKKKQIEKSNISNSGFFSI